MNLNNKLYPDDKIFVPNVIIADNINKKLYSVQYNAQKLIICLEDDKYLIQQTGDRLTFDNVSSLDDYRSLAVKKIYLRQMMDGDFAISLQFVYGPPVDFTSQDVIQISSNDSKPSKDIKFPPLDVFKNNNRYDYLEETRKLNSSFLEETYSRFLEDVKL